VVEPEVKADGTPTGAYLVTAGAGRRLAGSSKNFRIRADAAVACVSFALNPNDYSNYCFGGWLYACSGDLENAVACSNEALRRSPVVSDGCLETRLVAEYLAGNYQGAIMAYGRMVQPYLTPGLLPPMLSSVEVRRHAPRWTRSS
jgi:hypothetical protein